MKVVALGMEWKENQCKVDSVILSTLARTEMIEGWEWYLLDRDL